MKKLLGDCKCYMELAKCYVTTSIIKYIDQSCYGEERTDRYRKDNDALTPI